MASDYEAVMKHCLSFTLRGITGMLLSHFVANSCTIHKSGSEKFHIYLRREAHALINYANRKVLGLKSNQFVTLGLLSSP